MQRVIRHRDDYLLFLFLSFCRLEIAMNLLDAAKVIDNLLKQWIGDYGPVALKQIKEFRVAIEEAEKQEPVLWMDNRTDVVSPALRHTRKGYNTPLYLHPASSIPEGWKLVPIEPTPEMQNVMDKGSAYNTWRNMLDAAPQSPKEKP